MATLISIVLIISHFLLSSLIICSVTHGSTDIPCNQSPYPKVCYQYLITRNNSNLLEALDLKTKQYMTFLDLSFHVSMQQAMQVYRHLVSAMELHTDSFDDHDHDDQRAKSAWIDCLELYEDTIYNLNRSIMTGSKSNPIDHLTWLSASITNHQTCQNGFLDFNIYSHQTRSFPSLLIDDLSKLLSNSLALTKTYDQKPVTIRGRHRRLLNSDHHDGRFPEWVSQADRKLLQSEEKAVNSIKADLVVARDGSGNYKTISEAVEAAKEVRSGNGRFVIYVKAGVYEDNVEIKKTMRNIMIIGDGIGSTIVIGRKNKKDGSTTYRSATFGVSGDGFMARDITFENTAGPEKEQAVALRSGSDQSVFYRCSFKGYQDTLYVYSQRQFYRDCDIYGTVDFIFGDAVAVLQNCNIYVRKPMNKQKNTITAQARTDENENTGIIIHNCRITASSDLKPEQNLYKTYLGRPWKKYSRVVIMKSLIDGVVDPAGWLPWRGDFGLTTLYYGEFMNSGSGASVEGRVKWRGYHVISSASEAGEFTVGNFLDGDSWIPGTGVPFEAGL